MPSVAASITRTISRGGASGTRIGRISWLGCMKGNRMNPKVANLDWYGRRRGIIDRRALIGK